MSSFLDRFLYNSSAKGTKSGHIVSTDTPYASSKHTSIATHETYQTQNYPVQERKTSQPNLKNVPYSYYKDIPVDE
ncbi:unnamed protein product [Ambrosiozyma monospora]|uniref:Unnamed protein product n=1 Tax=Ambrosiozyma monospora TaxID=43982 RepID=A0A9W7DIY4_AMBMO|nr:unnamed protein product [Ambrosiozyma monospora]